MFARLEALGASHPSEEHEEEEEREAGHASSQGTEGCGQGVEQDGGKREPGWRRKRWQNLLDAVQEAKRKASPQQVYLHILH